MPLLLNRIGNILEENDLLQYSISFFLEQLWVKKHYLGAQYPDLATTFHRIGKTCIKNNQFLEVREYFLQALHTL